MCVIDLSTGETLNSLINSFAGCMGTNFVSSGASRLRGSILGFGRLQVAEVGDGWRLLLFEDLFQAAPANSRAEAVFSTPV